MFSLLITSSLYSIRVSIWKIRHKSFPPASLAQHLLLRLDLKAHFKSCEHFSSLKKNQTQTNCVVFSLWGCKELDMTGATSLSIALL